MPPKPDLKRAHVSPQKEGDTCAVCSSVFKKHAKAVLCDSCDKWLCTPCLKMTDEQYDLLTKMSSVGEITWFCPPCKISSKSAEKDCAPPVISRDELSDIISKSVPSISEISAIVNNAILGLKADITNKLNDVKIQISGIETELAKKCSLEDVETHVKAEVSVLKNEINTHLKDEVRKLYLQEKDRDRRKLNIVAYGIPTQPNDKTFLEKHLASNYGLQNLAVSDVKRLSNPNTPPINSSRPAPLIFSVPNVKTKRLILQKSYELRQEVQFRGDASKEDRRERKELAAELKRRRDAGESDLVISHGRIVSKNVDGNRGGPGGSAMVM